MIILELDIQQFGKLKDKRIEIRPGMNVISGAKDAGKTTIASFIKAMLFGFQSEEEYEKARPANANDAFGGTLRVVEGGLFYAVSRSFSRENPLLSVVKLPDKTEVENPEEWLARAVSAMGPAEYEKTGFLTEDLFLKTAYERRNEKAESFRALQECRETIKALERKRAGLLNQIEEINSSREQQKADEEIQELLRLKEEKEQEKKKARQGQQKRSLEEMDKLLQKSAAIQKETKELKHQLSEIKKELTLYAGVSERKAQGNIPAILLLTLGILAGIVAYFYMSAEKITGFDFSDTEQWILWALAGGSLLLFVPGFIWSIVFGAKKTKLVRQLRRKEQLYEEACKTEKIYEPSLKKAIAISREVQRYMTAAEKTVPNEKAQELDAEIREIDEKVKALSLKKTEETDRRTELLEAKASLASLQLTLAAFKETEEAEIRKTEQAGELPRNAEILKAIIEKFMEKDPGKTLPLIVDGASDGFLQAEQDEVLRYLRSLGRQVVLLTEQKSEI